MGHRPSVEPSRLTSSAKSHSVGNISSSSHTRVHSSPSLRKGRRKDATSCNKQDLVCRREDPNDPVAETEKLQANVAANTLPGDVKISPEVIVSDSSNF